jgi:predicted phosphodiesterase
VQSSGFTASRQSGELIKLIIARTPSGDSLFLSVADTIIRVFSDLHYGDRASRIANLAQLRPLLDGVSGIVLNGDTLDTRPGPFPAHTAEIRAETTEFIRHNMPAPVVLTGNHDADISERHCHEVADGRVFIVHGDILHETIVPWGRDGPQIQRQIKAELAALAPGQDSLDVRFAIWRRIAANIPQRHQSERNRLKYAFWYAADTIWPPLRVFKIFRAWREEPARAVTFARHYRPKAKFILLGHTHRPGVHRRPDGITVINTGSFCAPLGGYAVDVSDGRVTVREVVLRRSEFRLGSTIVELPID